jgi:Zn-dependent peptidase ImmA (M78 family)
MTKFEDLPEIKAAQEIINAYQYTKDTLPVNVKQIMADKKILVKYIELPDDISGVLDTREERPIVLIQKSHDKKRKRFSLAHELGHYVLKSSPRGVHLDRQTYFRSNLSSAGTDLEEKKANRFAAELLMPSDILLEILVKDMPDLIDANEKESLKRLKDLAKLFDVSVAALTIKISGVLKGIKF